MSNFNSETRDLWNSCKHPFGEFHCWLDCQPLGAVFRGFGERREVFHECQYSTHMQVHPLVLAMTSKEVWKPEVLVPGS